MQYLDSEFLDIENTFPFYAWLIPANASQEKKKFFSNSAYNPQFKYNFDQKVLDELENKIETINIPESVVEGFYCKLRQEYLRKIELIKNIGQPDEFARVSKNIYGDFAAEDIEFAEEVLNTYPDDGFREIVGAVKIKNELERKIKANNVNNWKVALRKNIASKVTVKPRENTVYVKSDYKFFPPEVERLKVHEIAVHLFRAENGANQEYRIFKSGLAGYLEAEEGLAVYFENKKGVCDPQQMKIYAARLKAVEVALKNSFRSTFETLKKWLPQEMAYRLCQRAKRGITDTSSAGALTKDIHYITGYRKVKKLLDTNDVLNELFTGKVGLDDVKNIKKLLSEGRIRKPVHIP